MVGQMALFFIRSLLHSFSELDLVSELYLLDSPCPSLHSRSSPALVPPLGQPSGGW